MGNTISFSKNSDDDKEIIINTPDLFVDKWLDYNIFVGKAIVIIVLDSIDEEIRKMEKKKTSKEKMNMYLLEQLDRIGFLKRELNNKEEIQIYKDFRTAYPFLDKVIVNNKKQNLNKTKKKK